MLKSFKDLKVGDRLIHIPTGLVGEVKFVNTQCYIDFPDGGNICPQITNTSWLPYFSLSTSIFDKKEGVLVEDKQRKKFYIVHDDMTEGGFLGCGSPLEVCHDYEWYEGRVEFKDGKYYFYGDTKVFLYTGMIVRR